MVIQINNLSFSYDTTQVLDDIQLKIGSGTFVSILGPNGCGKTTLLDLLVRHLKPHTGSISVNGSSLSSLSRKELSKQVALVSQNTTINFPFKVSEVIMMGRHPYISRFANPGKKDFEKVDAVMEQTGIKGLKDRLITQLSGGERQRCIVARALSQDTPILLLDEAFSNMDINHTLSLLKLIRDEVRNNKKTAVCVFHDINLASAWSDSLVFMESGRIAATGPTGDVLTKSVIQDVFHVEAHVDYNSYVGAKQVYFQANGLSSLKTSPGEYHDC